MTKTHPDSVSTLQQRAEEIYFQRLRKAAPQSAEIDTAGQIRKLQVKLIEQELLNQELIQAIKQTGQDSNRNAPVNPTNDLLSKNEECFKTTLDHMLEGCQIIGFDWRYLYLNRTAEVHNRRAIKELLGNRYMDMWPGIENTEVFKLIRQTLEERIPNRLENEFLFPNGEKGWFDLSIQPVPEGVFILSIDITDRKLNEIRLRESDLRFRKIFEEGPFGMALVNIDFRFSMANARLCEMLGFEETELKRLTFNDITHTDDIASDIRNVKRLIAGEIPVYRTEKRYIRKNGQLIWGSLTVAANYDDNGQFLYNVAIIEDITRRKVAEEQLLASKAKLETAIASMTDAIFISDASGQFIEFNDAFADFHKFRNRDECTRTFADYPNFLEVLFPDGGIVPVDQWAVPRALRGEVAKNAEYKLRRKDTGETWIGSYSFAPIRDGNGTIIGAVVAGRDITDRKQAEEALRISEERYRNIFESAVIGIYRTSPEGKILMANSTLIKMLGFDSFEELAQRDLEKEGFEDINQRNKFRKSIAKDNSLTGLESVWKTKDGRSVIVQENAKAISDNNGNILYYEGTIEDITERKKMERTLRESEEKFRNAFLTNPDSITITRLQDGIYTSVNNGFTQIFGYAEEEVLGKTPLDINMWNTPDDRKRFVQELKIKGVVENFEARLCTKNGELKDTLVSATVIDLDGVSHILSTTKDITERKTAEETLRYNEALLNEMGRIAKIGGWEFTPGTGQVSWTEEVARIHDLDPTSSISAKAGINYYDEQSIPIIEKALREAIETGRPFDLELVIVTAKGNQKWVRTIGNPVQTNGTVTKIHGSFQDITERKKAEREIRELNETLEQRVEDRTAQLKAANEELEAFSYSVSHDLRAPLRHINGFVDLLNEKYNELLPEKGLHYLKTIVNSSRHMGTLIDDLLQFSRTGRQEMRQSDLDMNLVLQEVMESVRSDIHDRNIEWNISKLPKITADHSLVKIVWFNLLSNAVKFSKEKNPTIIQIGFHEDEKEYTFFVQDNGAGFDMQYADKLFGVFQRLHSQQEFDGTGIGLANVRRIIQKHGGRTWAISQLEKGATFYFTIPKN